MIYVTDDLHGEIGVDRLSFKNWPESKKLTKSDYLIITGDFGLIWYNPPRKSELWWLKWLEERPYTILFIDGNHENFELLYEYPVVDLLGFSARQIRNNIFHLRRGCIYHIDGLRMFAFGGAMSTDKEHRQWGISWWPQEIPNYQEMNFGLDQLNKYNNYVDYIFTHTIPASLIYHQLNLFSRSEDPTAKYLEHIWNNVQFKHWYAGHFHEARTFDNKLTIPGERIIRIK